MTARNLGSAALQFVVGAISVMGFLSGIIGITAVCLFAVASAEDVIESDQIVASFERELAHEAPEHPAVAGSAVDSDILYEALGEILWSPEPQECSKIERLIFDSDPV